MNKQSIPQAGLKLFIIIVTCSSYESLHFANKKVIISVTATVRVTHDISLYQLWFQGFIWTGRIYLTFSFKSLKFNTLRECKCHQSAYNIFSNWGNYMILLVENLIWVTIIIWERKKNINLAYYICKRLEMQTHFIYALYFKE